MACTGSFGSYVFNSRSHKSTKSIEQLGAMLPWAKDVPLALVRFIGISEFLEAIGLLLPSILTIRPNLTPIAASALALIQVLAMRFHISRAEASTALPLNIFILAMALFVAWGRFKKVPIQAK